MVVVGVVVVDIFGVGSVVDVVNDVVNAVVVVIVVVVFMGVVGAGVGPRIPKGKDYGKSVNSTHECRLFRKVFTLPRPNHVQLPHPDSLYFHHTIKHLPSPTQGHHSDVVPERPRPV